MFQASSSLTELSRNSAARSGMLNCLIVFMLITNLLSGRAQTNGLILR